MYYKKRKLLYKNEDKKTSYYIAGFGNKRDYDLSLFVTNTFDILLKGPTHKGFIKKKFAFDKYDLLINVNREIKDYSFEQFLADVAEVDDNGYIVIYAVRPPRPIRKKTERREEELQMIIAFSACNTAFL